MTARPTAAFGDRDRLGSVTPRRLVQRVNESDRFQRYGHWETTRGEQHALPVLFMWWLLNLLPAYFTQKPERSFNEFFARAFGAARAHWLVISLLVSFLRRNVTNGAISQFSNERMWKG